jgi:hypothetical protein
MRPGSDDHGTRYLHVVVGSSSRGVKRAFATILGKPGLDQYGAKRAA